MISFNEIQENIKDEIHKDIINDTSTNGKDVVQGDLFDVFVPEYYSEAVLTSAFMLAISYVKKTKLITAATESFIFRGWQLADNKEAYRLKDDKHFTPLIYSNTLALNNAFELTLKYYNFKLFSALHSGQHRHAKVFYRSSSISYYSLSNFNTDELNGLWLGVVLRYIYDIYVKELKAIGSVKILKSRPSDLWINLLDTEVLHYDGKYYTDPLYKILALPLASQ